MVSHFLLFFQPFFSLLENEMSMKLVIQETESIVCMIGIDCDIITYSWLNLTGHNGSSLPLQLGMLDLPSLQEEEKKK